MTSQSHPDINLRPSQRRTNRIPASLACSGRMGFYTLVARRALSMAPKSPSLYFAATRALSSNTQHMIINAVGLDRPGIVAEMTKLTLDAGGNVGESQAAKLGPHFSVLMMVQVPQSNCSSLKESLDAMEGMNATVFETQAPEGSKPTPNIGYSGTFRVSGADNPGIVYKVTSLLAHHGLSIDTLGTMQETVAPHGGTHLFHMKGKANALEPLAHNFDVNRIKDDLEALGDSLNCEITMDDVDDDEMSASSFGG